MAFSEFINPLYLRYIERVIGKFELKMIQFLLVFQHKTLIF